MDACILNSGRPCLTGLRRQLGIIGISRLPVRPASQAASNIIHWSNFRFILLVRASAALSLPASRALEIGTMVYWPVWHLAMSEITFFYEFPISMAHAKRSNGQFPKSACPNTRSQRASPLRDPTIKRSPTWSTAISLEITCSENVGNWHGRILKIRLIMFWKSWIWDHYLPENMKWKSGIMGSISSNTH